MMTEGQVLISDPAKVVWGHPVSQQFFVDNLRLRRDRDMKKVSVCLFRQYASTHMQLGSCRDLDLRLNFGLSMSACMFRCVLTRGTRCRSNFISIVLGSKLISEKTYGKKLHFYLPWHLEANVLTLRHIWWEKRRSVSCAIICFFIFGAAIIVLEIVVGIPDNNHHSFSKIWPLLNSADLNIHLNEKWPKWLRTGSLKAFDGRIARSSSFPSFRVEGDHFDTPPPHHGEGGWDHHPGAG